MHQKITAGNGAPGPDRSIPRTMHNPLPVRKSYLFAWRVMNSGNNTTNKRNNIDTLEEEGNI